MMRLCVIGTGYVGLTTAVGMASLGHTVIGVEKRQEILEQIRGGVSPIFEQGLQELLGKVLKQNNLALTGNISEAVLASEISIICVGTPSRPDGSIDLGAIREVSSSIGKALASKKEFHVVVVKSTVLPGTTLELVGKTIEEQSGKVAGKDFGIAMVPEFLREGTALKDFLEPDRIVVGVEEEKTGRILGSLFRAGFRAPLVLTSTKTAEMIKYANNSFLALCISFSNEIAQLCELAGGVDASEVLSAVVKDGRITRYAADGSASAPGIAKYLIPGCGFGGSCFPKDLRAIAAFEKSLGMQGGLVEKTIEINRRQVGGVVEKAVAIFGGKAHGRQVAVLGASFKPQTTDIRESPSIAIIEGMLSKGAEVRLYDPQALGEMKKIFGPKLTYAPSAREALKGAELAIVATAWKEFASITPKDFSSLMKKARVLDCRMLYDRRAYSEEIEYHRVGYRG